MKTPDIEIYVKNAEMSEVASWLNKHFSGVQLPNHFEQIFSKGKTIKATIKNETGISELIITPQAAGKTFGSLWFKNNITQWNNDEECALSLLEDSDTEIRCSASSWTEAEEQDSAQWLLLTRNERKLINWS